MSVLVYPTGTWYSLMMAMPSTVDVSFGLSYRYLIFFDDGYAQYCRCQFWFTLQVPDILWWWLCPVLYMSVLVYPTGTWYSLMMVMLSTVDAIIYLPYRYLIFFDDGYAQYSRCQFWFTLQVPDILWWWLCPVLYMSVLVYPTGTWYSLMMAMPSTVDVSFGLPYRYLIFFDDGYAQYCRCQFWFTLQVPDILWWWLCPVL